MVITLDEARARGIALPTDNDAAQSVIDEQEAWLTTRVGPLTGERTETFRVDGSCDGTLYLARHADSVEVTDGESVLILDEDFLYGHGTVSRVFGIYPARWIGPLVEVTYTPPVDEVRRVLFSLIGFEAAPTGPYESEQIGSYSYHRSSTGGTAASAQRAALASSLIPHRPTSQSVPYARRYGPLRVAS